MADWVSGAISGGLGVIGGAISGSSKRQQKRQLRNQKALNEQAAMLNYQYGEMSADAAAERTRQAEIEREERNSLTARLEEADANNISRQAVINGSGGVAGGGAQGQGAGGQKGGQAPDEAAAQDMKRRQLLEFAQIGAAISQLKAETRKTNAETESIEDQTETNKDTKETNKQIIEETLKNLKKERELKNVTIEKATEEIKSDRVKRAGNELQNRITEIEGNIAESGEEFRIEAIKWEVERLIEEVRGARADNELKEEQKDDIIKALKAQIALTQMQTSAAAAGITLTNAQVTKIYNDINIDNADLEIRQDVNTYGTGNIYDWKSWKGLAKFVDTEIRNLGKEAIETGKKIKNWATGNDR